MAIIKCPDCGGDVSTSSSQCVHCGCKISVCPDCGNVMLGENNVCSACGYDSLKKKTESEVLSQDTNKVEQSVGAITDGNALHEKWLDESSFYGFLDNRGKLFIRVFSIVLSLSLLGFCLFRLFIWRDSDALQMVIDYKDVSDSVRLAAIIVVISAFVGDFLSYVIDSFLTLQLCAWLRKNVSNNPKEWKPILSSLTKLTNASRYKRNKEIPTRVCNAVFLSVHEKDKAHYLLRYILNVILDIACVVALIIFINDNLEALMTNMMLMKNPQVVEEMLIKYDFVGIIVVFIITLFMQLFRMFDITGFTAKRTKWEQSIIAKN